MRNDLQEPRLKEDDGYSKVSTVLNPISSENFVSKISPQNSLQSKASEGSILNIHIEYACFINYMTRISFHLSIFSTFCFTKELTQHSMFCGLIAYCSIYLSKLIVANENILEKKHDFYSTKQNEDFATLEQALLHFIYRDNLIDDEEFVGTSSSSMPSVSDALAAKL
ncbi:hypothetical protein ERO13_A03G037650v2 [Gossypium hirsutum]|nr:hypothetical protein ERO13_A03G037650v2 [Gossypium hirsutum]